MKNAEGIEKVERPIHHRCVGVKNSKFLIFDPSSVEKNFFIAFLDDNFLALHLAATHFSR